LVDAAARADMNLTIDAEESDRLELSLYVFERLAQRIAAEHPRWRGFGWRSRPTRRGPWIACTRWRASRGRTACASWCGW
jgi:hypothetical protein